jgi:hypothetical protein
MTTRKYTSRSQQTTLTSAVTSGATILPVVAATTLLGGATISTGQTFTAVIDPDTALEEIVDVTAVSGNNLTITRAIDGSSAQDHSAGAVVRHMIIGRDLREANEHIEKSTNVHGLAVGVYVVGDTTAQTLTNKTLTTPIVNGATISGAFTSTATITGGTITGATVTGLTSAGLGSTDATPKSYVDAILGSSVAAATSATSAAASATAAATSASSAATSASSALTSQTAAATSATSAAASATAAATSATSAATQATAAATSATSAAASATAAATSATSAANSATTAAASVASIATYASNAATSATSAANSATAAATSAASAAASTSAAAASATAAATSATSAAASATAAATSASSAATQATAAATSATSAAASATAATTSATSAAASATAAATSATSAAASATAAASSATAAATSYDDFDDRYLGSKTSAPTVDNDGNTLLVGAIYWNSTDGKMYVWSGTVWVQIATTSVYTAPTLGSTTINSGTTYTNINGLTVNSTTIPTSATLTKTSDKLSVFAATTSAELKGVISDETGSGALVFGTSPTITGATISLAADPSSALDAVTKQYADGIAAGVNTHDSVSCATTSALTGTYTAGTTGADGGTGVGATFTITATGALIIDGYTTVLNDRVLVKNQSTQTQNGIYKVTTAGTSGVQAVLTRTTDYDNSIAGEVFAGDLVFIVNGTVAAGQGWVMNVFGTSTTPSKGIKIGTDNIVWTQFTTTGLPSQTGNGGKYLTTDGSTASWATVGGETFNPLLLMGA